MNKNKEIKIIISPYNSLGKNSFFIISFIIFLFFIFFSMLWFSIGAWPITIFMGAEYIALSTLVFIFYKKRKIKEHIKIDSKRVTYNFYEENKLKTNMSFSSYWVKIIFWKEENHSKLILSESGKKIELGKFLHSDIKEKIYVKLNNFLKIHS